MTLQREGNGRIRFVFSLSVVLLILSLGCSSFLAVNAALHRLLHDDAGHASHQCAVTLLEKQQVLAGDSPEVLATWSFDIAWDLPAFSVPFVSALDLRLHPERAPPV